jgi:hypothetical protein
MRCPGARRNRNRPRSGVQARMQSLRADTDAWQITCLFVVPSALDLKAPGPRRFARGERNTDQPVGSTSVFPPFQVLGPFEHSR